MEQNKIKEIVKEKYGEIAVKQPEEGCCKCSCKDNKDKGSDPYNTFHEDYTHEKGYVSEADLGLGCGMPTQYAGIKAGDTVVDLGSGAGNDVFVTRSIVGDSGKVYGIDMTEEMVQKANENKEKLGYKNVEFLHGELENLPLEDNTTDAVISNCVINLVPDKEKVFNEIKRVLKTGGHFSVSDIVLKGNLPEKLQQSKEIYSCCIGGAIQEENYLSTIKKVGFKDIQVKSKKQYSLTRELVSDILNPEETDQFLNSEFGMYSITVVGFK